MDTSNLMEQILSSDNLNRAYLQVVRNKGAEGVDGMKYTELKEHLERNGENIKEQLRARKYKPQAVRRVEIPKPEGGVRNLGVPTVTDRFIQQAIAQVLTPIYEEQFHDHSYGFRPNRCAQQAIQMALDLMNDGNDWIVDIDMEKFFDTVKHDKLITIIGRTIKDGDVISIIRKYLVSGLRGKASIRSKQFIRSLMNVTSRESLSSSRQTYSLIYWETRRIWNTQGYMTVSWNAVSYILWWQELPFWTGAGQQG